MMSVILVQQFFWYDIAPYTLAHGLDLTDSINTTNAYCHDLGEAF